MTDNFVSRSTVTINAPAADVWDALINPVKIKTYMFGADVHSSWQIGSPITWKGEMKGKPYEDKGTILRVERARFLQYTHFSPMAGKSDTPENHHTVTIELSGKTDRTDVTLTQDKNETEEARDHSQKNWNTMLQGLKKVVEG